MAKDIIFQEKRQVFTPVKQEHFTSDNNTFDEMRKKIENVKSVREAMEILLKEWGRDFCLFIINVIREKFPEVPYEEISHYF